MGCSPPGSLWFSRQEYWSGLPFPSPRAFPDPGKEPRSSTWQVDSLPSEPPGKNYFDDCGLYVLLFELCHCVIGYGIRLYNDQGTFKIGKKCCNWAKHTQNSLGFLSSVTFSLIPFLIVCGCDCVCVRCVFFFFCQSPFSCLFYLTLFPCICLSFYSSISLSLCKHELFPALEHWLVFYTLYF